MTENTATTTHIWVSPDYERTPPVPEMHTDQGDGRYSVKLAGSVTNAVYVTGTPAEIREFASAIAKAVFGL